MLKKTITFENFSGGETTEDHYFHLSKADLVELEMTHKGGLQGYIQRIVDSNDGKAIIEEFKRLIMMSYGKKNEDGTRFVKNEELRQDFLSSPAYDSLFMELVTDAKKAAAFVNGIIPRGLADEAAKVAEASPPARTVNEVIEAERIKENGKDEPVENVFDNDVPIPDSPDSPSQPRLLTQMEAESMTINAIRAGVAAGEFRLA